VIIASLILNCADLQTILAFSPMSISPMSRTPSPGTPTPSSHFQAIFDAALKAYEARTKEDLTAHPLASQFHSCDSTNAILSLLQGQVREFDQANSNDERLTKWLNPTVTVLLAFSAVAGDVVSMVSLEVWSNVGLNAHSNMSFLGVFACEHGLCRRRYPSYSEYLINPFARLVLMFKFCRQPRVWQRAKILSPSSLNA